MAAESTRSRPDLSPLLEAARSGDRTALSELLDELQPRLSRFGKRLCPRHAEDALQESLLQLSLKLPEFRGEADIYSWAYTLVRSACTRQTRGLKNADHLEYSSLQEEQSEGLSPEQELLLGERRAKLEQALRGLPEEQRVALLLRDIEELSAEEAAEVLGLSVPALKSRLHRARRSLSEQIEQAPALPGCPDVIEALSQEREGELAPGRCAELHAHLLLCPSCASRCDGLKAALQSCRQFSERPPRA